MSDNSFRKGQVLDSQEFRRVLALRRVEMTQGELDGLVRDLTGALKTSKGTMALRPIQARALHAIGTIGGLFGPMRVGAGKTLTSLLAAYVMDAKRPILILPAHLVEKTKVEMRELERHWIMPRNLRMISYQMLGREGSAKLLEQYKPDMIIADEAQKLKNRKAAVTRRVARYMTDHPETRFVAISGTIMKDSIKDFAHVLTWCLKEGAPVPHKASEVEEWADCLDEKLQNPFKRLAPGPLLRLATKEDWDEVEDRDEIRIARRGFRRRLIDTPGVVATQNEQVDCKLRITALEYEMTDLTEAHFHKLRSSWMTPDDWALMMATEAWRVARELAMGLHYTWIPRPPEEWRNARREWAAYVRDTLSRSRTLDSELQVRNEVLRGNRPDGTSILQAWKEQEPTFQINSRPAWHDDSALDVCAEWMKKGPGIVWTEHSFFAHELAKRTGARYFGQEGKDQKGIPIELADPRVGPIIASVPANGTGRNLQAWARNLITSCPTCPAAFEQLLGRTHRDGQKADLVDVDVLLGCKEHFTAWQSALAGAQAALETTGLSQKLLVCDVVGFPDEDEIISRPEARWGNVSKTLT